MTKLQFSELDKAFRDNEFPTIENDSRGIRFLKLRSMSRKATMEEFCEQHNISLEDINSRKYFFHIFEISTITDAMLNFNGYVEC